MKYIETVTNPIYVKNHHVNWAVFFWIAATNFRHPSKSVNDFCDKMNWDEDTYPRDTLLRSYPRVKHTFFKNLNTAFCCHDDINKKLMRGWVQYTYDFWRESIEFYGLDKDPKESYLDFLQVEGEARKTLQVIVNKGVNV